tara:strand:- start:1609 stop:2718 length:1110 start_codon:yes stop_codon:yes gene_type:complete
MNEEKKTRLHDLHKSAGAKIISFGGWAMPVSYESLKSEHLFVRSNCGIFDVSHMGEVIISGNDALEFLQFATINDVNKLKLGMGQYTAILNHEGGFIDDLIAYRIGEKKYLLCINAANIDKDVSWLKKVAADFDVNLKNESELYSQIAVQGPTSNKAVLSLLQDQAALEIDQINYMEIAQINLFGQQSYIARTGYTGEMGYEIYLPNSIADQCWESLLACKATQVKPIGLGARDTLRLEAGYLLYGNDMDEKVNPFEAGISWATKMECGDFIGRKSLEKIKSEGVNRKIVAFTLLDKGIAREGMTVYVNNEEIGEVTSGSFLPTLDCAGGMALVRKNAVKVDDTVEVEVRGKRKLAKIVKKPLYSSKTK